MCRPAGQGLALGEAGCDCYLLCAYPWEGLEGLGRVSGSCQ